MKTTNARKFKIEINTDGRYDGIWNFDIFPDYHEMYGDILTLNEIIEDVALSWWDNMDSDEYELLAREGINNYKEMIKAYAWRISEIIGDDIVLIGTV